MSVWFTESFRGQILWDWSRLGALNRDDWIELCSKVQVSFTGGTLKATDDFPERVYPRGSAATLAIDFRQMGVDFRDIFFESPRRTRATMKSGHITKYLMPRTQKFHTGLSAVFALYRALDTLPSSYVAFEAAQENRFLSTFVDHAFRAQAGLMKTTAGEAENAARRVSTKALTQASRWQIISRRMRTLFTYRWKAHPARESRGQFKVEPTSHHDAEPLQLPDDWSVYFDGWVTYVRLPDHDEDEILALTSVDLDRVQQMCISRSMLELHEATWATTAGNSLDEYVPAKRRIMTIFHQALDRAAMDPSLSNVLCRDMRKVFNTYLSMAAGELSDDATDVMLMEMKAKKYDKSFNARAYLRVLQSCPFDIAQDLGRIYKLLPAPDYDIGESFVARQEQHLAMNPLKPITGDNPCNIDEFRQYMRKLMILTLTQQNRSHGIGKFRGTRKPRWWDDYAKHGVLPDRLDVVDQIDLRGVSPYVEREPESVTSWKDSAACEEELDDVLKAEDADLRKRNMLLRYLFDPSCPDSETARVKLPRTHHVHRVGFKMESHKPVARLFFIGNLSDRLVQSEMEENVHRVARHCPGYMIGQTPEFTSRKIMSMVAPRLLPNESVKFLNFDISAWSPGMRDDIQRVSHEIWAEVFDREEFLHAAKINERSHVVLNKRGYTGIYVNPGANFEGYNGKEMTFMHCALMGYSVYRYRRASGHRITVSLAAYIDDGLAAFKEEKALGNSRFLAFADSVEETYQSLGFLLEKSKCFLSDKFAIFLNEIYLNGRHVTYGLRAIMRVGTKVFEPHQSLCERANSYFSGTQGALRAGLDVVAGVITYLWLIGRLLLIYGVEKYMDARAATLYALTPRALGGMGAPSFVGVTSNLVADGLAEGICALQELVRAYPAYKPKVIALLRQPVAQKTTTGILLSPDSLPDHLAPMSESRLTNAVASALVKAHLAPKARRFIALAKGMKLDEFADAILRPSTSVVPATLDALIGATPFALLMALTKKFESSRTMIQLIGPRVMRRVVDGNRDDAIRSLGVFRRR